MRQSVVNGNDAELLKLIIYDSAKLDVHWVGPRGISTYNFL